MVTEISVAVENFGAAEAAAGLFLLDVFRENVSEFVAVLDVLNFQLGTGLILGIDDNGAEAEELLTEGALYADVLHSVEKNFVLIGAEEAGLVDELLGGDGVCGERPGQREELASWKIPPA